MTRRCAAIALAALTLQGCGFVQRSIAVNLRYAVDIPHRDWRVPSSPLPPLPEAKTPASLLDQDGDGLPDSREDALARRFAPIVYHERSELHKPTNVDAFLRRVKLAYYDDDCKPDLKLELSVVTQEQLLTPWQLPTCGSSYVVRADGTRSRRKQHTYFLEDVETPADRAGSSDPSEWTTYVHAYPNDQGGVTLQYWRVYAYNGLFPEHGGDWEGIHVVLDGRDRPVRVRLLGHRDIEELPPALMAWERLDAGDHPVIFADRGGHTSDAAGDWKGQRQETWQVGGLVNVGEKSRPLNGQEFIRYSGLWGTPGTFYETGGYWGPAYNETGMDEETGFITAWCEGMRDPGKVVDGVRECYPTAQSR
ncbi:MAG: hypothetical protein ACREL3_08705 [Gemmatimonadales bacterium]